MRVEEILPSFFVYIKIITIFTIAINHCRIQTKPINQTEQNKCSFIGFLVQFFPSCDYIDRESKTKENKKFGAINKSGQRPTPDESVGDNQNSIPTFTQKDASDLSAELEQKGS